MEQIPFVIDLPNLDATAAFGRRLAGLLFPGAIIGLIGPLGAGKTNLVRAVAEGLGLRDGRAISSPTFGLIHEYKARLPVHHFDAYRLKSVAEFQDLGAHEYFEGGGVSLIEWADRVAVCLPAERLQIQLEVTGETSRRATVTAFGSRYEAILEPLAA
jgi:tRNA threonylcarbamoyladenosine biosynthesis protein TsaE